MLFNNTALKRSSKISKYEQLANDCAILFCKSKKILDFRRSRVGISAKKGWYEPLKRLCCRLEALNINYYQKYGIRIQAEQIKEKFGTLRFYFRVTHDDNGLLAKLSNQLYKISKWIEDNIDFKMKTIVDEPSFIEHVVEQMDDEEFKENKSRWEKCVNVQFEELDNGAKVMICDHDKFKSTHQVPTKHNLLFKVKELAWSMHVRLQPMFSNRDSSEISVLIEQVDADANDLVKTAEDECAHLCEDCGAQIGTEWSPTCTTCGWVSYICEKCAQNSIGKQYYKNGALWAGNICLKTKEQVEEEQKEFEAKVNS